MENVEMTIGERLKQARKKAKLSMYAAAMKAGMRPEQVLRLERASDARVSTIRKLVKAYGLTLSELLKGI